MCFVPIISIFEKNIDRIELKNTLVEKYKRSRICELSLCWVWVAKRGVLGRVRRHVEDTFCSLWVVCYAAACHRYCRLHQHYRTEATSREKTHIKICPKTTATQRTRWPTCNPYGSKTLRKIFTGLMASTESRRTKTKTEIWVFVPSISDMRLLYGMSE